MGNVKTAMSIRINYFTRRHNKVKGNVCQVAAFSAGRQQRMMGVEIEGGAAVLLGFEKLLCSPLRLILWELVKQTITSTPH